MLKAFASYIGASISIFPSQTTATIVLIFPDVFDGRVFDMSLRPKCLCNFERIDFEVLPPCFLVANLMELTMVHSAQWHGEFIADLLPECTRLGIADVMRV